MSFEFEQKVVKELESINRTLNEHEKKFEAIDKRFEAIDKRFEAIDKRFDTMDQQFEEKFAQIQHSLEVITQSVVIIENKVSTEIPTLFDGYASNKELQELEHESLTSLNLKVENHDIRISILEQNAM